MHKRYVKRDLYEAIIEIIK